MYENVLNNIVKVAYAIGGLLATPYITIRIMEDIGCSDGKNINSYTWLNYHMNVP